MKSTMLSAMRSKRKDSVTQSKKAQGLGYFVEIISLRQ